MPAGGGSRSLVRFPDDFTYLGAFLVPDFTSLFAETQFGRGLAFRRVAADTTEPRHLLSMGFGPAGSPQLWSMYEFRVGTPEILPATASPSEYTLTTIVKDYVRQPYTTAAGEDMMNSGELSGHNGLFIDPTDSTKVWWTQSNGYGSAGWFGYGILDYANETAVGHGRWVLTSPLFKSTSSGFAVVPQSFNDDHLGGTMRMVVGFGGGESVHSIGDVSLGVSATAFNPDFDEGDFPGETLTVLDLACDGSTTVTSASNPFPESLLPGHKVYIYGLRANGWETGESTASFTVASRNSAGSITLTVNPSFQAGTPATAAAQLFGSGTILTEREILVSYHPSALAPDASHGRMEVHGGGASKLQPFDPVDSWPKSVMGQSQNDNVQGVVWIDDDDHYGLLSFGISASGYTVYLSAQVPSSYTDDWAATFDPDDLAPVSSDEYFEIQPEYNDRIEWPTTDYTSAPYVLGPEKTVTEITSDSGKNVASADGCVFACAGHGYSAGNPVQITGSDVPFYNTLFTAHPINDDSFYAQNLSREATNWPGTTSSNGGIVARRIASGERDQVRGVAYDPVDKILYVLQQNKPGLGFRTLVLMYQKD